MGCASLEKNSIVCGCPSSKTEKSRACRPRTSRPRESVTRTPTVTSDTFTRKMFCGIRNSSAAMKNRVIRSENRKEHAKEQSKSYSRRMKSHGEELTSEDQRLCT